MELREFSGREVVNNQVRQKPSEESYYLDKKAGSLDENLTESDRAQKPVIRTLEEREQEMEIEEDENISTLISIKRWKYNG